MDTNFRPLETGIENPEEFKPFDVSFSEISSLEEANKAIRILEMARDNQLYMRHPKINGKINTRVDKIEIFISSHFQAADLSKPDAFDIPIGFVDVEIKFMDEIMYKESMPYDNYYKYNQSWVREIERFLFGNQSQSSTNVSNDCCNCRYFVGHRRLKTFNFKQKFFKIQFKKFFMGFKSAPVIKFKSLL